ncbi:YopX family protein [Lysinibacillus irui]|uniref:YopX family protein n=1 Tax=Lysinibacillus irui TaxID=2998077 RepID=UPI002AD48D3F|nr:YopX family protein [Lysinibacillus irui]MEA0564569.1 YopX family protein [Lysinibacillus irui]
MRKIKFRAFLKEKKKMLPVTYLTLSDEENEQVGIADCNNEGCVLCVDFYDYEKVELMQYTGLKDKNGKEIYEGDIVKTHDQNNVIEYEHGSFLVKGLHADEYERTYSVLYHYLVDATIPDMPHSRFDGVTTTLEVIGNMYENPELLEELQNGTK